VNSLLIKSTVTDLNSAALDQIPTQVRHQPFESRTERLEFAVTRASASDLSERTLPRSHNVKRRREGKSSIKARSPECHVSKPTARRRRGCREGASSANQGKRLCDY